MVEHIKRTRTRTFELTCLLHGGEERVQLHKLITLTVRLYMPKFLTKVSILLFLISCVARTRTRTRTRTFELTCLLQGGEEVVQLHLLVALTVRLNMPEFLTKVSLLHFHVSCVACFSEWSSQQYGCVGSKTSAAGRSNAARVCERSDAKRR